MKNKEQKDKEKVLQYLGIPESQVKRQSDLANKIFENVIKNKLDEIDLVKLIQNEKGFTNEEVKLWAFLKIVKNIMEWGQWE